MTKRSYHHGDLRNSLIEAGIKLINQGGPEQLSLRKLAALCDVSQAAPYSHFKNKEDLLEAMQNYVIEKFMKVLSETIESCPAQNDPYVIIQFGKAYVTFFINNPQYYSFLFSQSNIEINLSLDDSGENNFQPFELFKKIVIRILGQNETSKEKLLDTIISCWATVQGLTSIATMKNVHYKFNWETKIEDIIWRK